MTKMPREMRLCVEKRQPQNEKAPQWRRFF
jgi:hypothetical protein